MYSTKCPEYQRRKFPIFAARLLPLGRTFLARLIDSQTASKLICVWDRDQIGADRQLSVQAENWLMEFSVEIRGTMHGF
jgi:hypothetical protein